MKDRKLIKYFGKRYGQLCDEYVLAEELTKMKKRLGKLSIEEKVVFEKSREKLITAREIESALVAILVTPLSKSCYSKNLDKVMKKNLEYLWKKGGLPGEYYSALKQYFFQSA